MNQEYQPFYSHKLQREMPIRIYGHGGRPVIFIPCQDGHSQDFEGFGMVNTFAPWIDSGRCTVYAIDTMDAESWSDQNGDPWHRIRRHEAWIEYIVQEVVPYINDRTGWRGCGIMVFGCSLGASHAVNLFLRFPEIFDRCLALSGLYHASYFFGSYMDDVVYRNSPADYLANMPADHPYIQIYNRNKAVICTGQGAWEEHWSPRALAKRFQELDIHVWVDFWGFDVNHDWPWWHKQTEYFLPYLLD